eukprot:1925740-Ditylum_brightwellii.AAC.1
MAWEVDGSAHCAEVIHRAESMDCETQHYLVHLGDRKRKGIMTYDAIVEAIDRWLISEVEKTDEQCLWVFKEVIGHGKN